MSTPRNIRAVFRVPAVLLAKPRPDTDASTVALPPVTVVNERPYRSVYGPMPAKSVPRPRVSSEVTL